MRALGGWRLIRIFDGFSVWTNAGGPREVLDELFGEQQRAVGPIEDVEKAVAVRLYQQHAALALPACIDDHRRLGGIPVPQVVRRELVIPLQPASRWIEREDAVGVKVVAYALIPL